MTPDMTLMMQLSVAGKTAHRSRTLDHSQTVYGIESASEDEEIAGIHTRNTPRLAKTETA